MMKNNRKADKLIRNQEKLDKATKAYEAEKTNIKALLEGLFDKRIRILDHVTTQMATKIEPVWYKL